MDRGDMVKVKVSYISMCECHPTAQRIGGVRLAGADIAIGKGKVKLKV